MSDQGQFSFEVRASAKSVPSKDRYAGAMLAAAVGDALGWPTEYYGRRIKKSVDVFISWKKRVGGRWWGYVDEIARGEYSDDTQLSLAVARCITDSGAFRPETFAYEELPLWLQYERGGGRSVKLAARSLLNRRRTWSTNFYKQRSIDYWSAGANGAAMRNLPIVLAALPDKKSVMRYSLHNAITTHGHPRALVGTALMAATLRYAFELRRNDEPLDILPEVRADIERLPDIIRSDDDLTEWAKKWRGPQGGVSAFKDALSETIREAKSFLSAIGNRPHRDPETYYAHVGAFDPETKGSGVGTVCAATYLWLHPSNDPFEKVRTAVNLVGSDTDTIANFVGSLVGAQFGTGVVPTELKSALQDRDYILKVAHRLHDIASGEREHRMTLGRGVTKQDSYLLLLSWEMGLHDLFWSTNGERSPVLHPRLGPGLVVGRQVKALPRKGQEMRLIKVRFNSGQSCIFHSRVEGDRVAESLGKNLQGGLPRSELTTRVYQAQ